MKLSCAVMAHPKREAMVDELLEQLDRPVPVVWDEINDRHDTGIRALTAYDPACTHHLVIQDDVVPCPDLLAGTEAALRWVPPDSPVSLYVGKVRPFGKAVSAAVASADDASWITMDGIYWGPAVVIPTNLIPALEEFYRASQVQNYDRRMSRWFERRGVRCWYTWPSLVDHRGDESLVRGHGPGRHAHRHADRSALDIDWSGPVVEMKATARLDRNRQNRAQRAARVAHTRG